MNEKRIIPDVEELKEAIRTMDELWISTREKICDSIDSLAQPVKTEAIERPKIVCLCGSTRFKDQFEKTNRELTMFGIIVLSVGVFGHNDSIKLSESEKIMLDELHRRKIDLADEILVLNVEGYIGESTQSEIDYAIAHNKPVRYLKPNSKQ